jgi:hypothetical protein
MVTILGTAKPTSLQAILSSASAPAIPDTGAALPHHPITCTSELRLEPDGTLACEHATASVGDARTRSCLNHSLALLLIELAQSL